MREEFGLMFLIMGFLRELVLGKSGFEVGEFFLFSYFGKGVGYGNKGCGCESKLGISGFGSLGVEGFFFF